MKRIVEQLRAEGARRVATLLAVAALAAALVYVGVREAGVGERSEAGAVVAQEQPMDAGEDTMGGAEPLTLTLSAPEICEAQHPHGGWDHGLAWNEEEQVWEDIEADAWWYWGHEGTVEVDWTASGGDGAYTVTIAGEAYTGASGTTEVSCALRHGPVRNRERSGRTYDNEDKPFVDSGLKMITAAVADESGATAEAAAEVYVILAVEDESHVLRSGETYRIRGWLVTVPEGVEIDSHRGVEESVCVKTRYDGTVDETVNCEDSFHLGWSAPEYRAVLSLGMDSGEEGDRLIWWDQDLEGADADDMAVAQALFDWVVEKLNELAASVGQLPKLGDD